MEVKIAAKNRGSPLVRYLEALPTCEFLIYRRLEITNICCMCNQSSENIYHIFKSCHFVQRIWDCVKYNCPTPLFSKGNFLS